MNLLKEFLRREIRTLVDNDIRLHVLGRWRELDPSVVAHARGGARQDRRGQAHGLQHRAQLLRPLRDRRRLPQARRPAGAAGERARDRRGGDLRSARDRRAARSRPADSHFGRDAGLELPALADRLLRDLSSPRPSGPTSGCSNLLEAIVAFQGRERRFGGIEAPRRPRRRRAGAETSLEPEPPSATAQNFRQS